MNDPHDLTIAYIGGGSRGWATTLMKDLAMDPDLSGTVRLHDIDREAAAMNASIGNDLSARPDVVGRWRYEAVDDLRGALAGADFVVLSILPGTFAEMASDVHAPEAFGLYQSVGDTAGPGGTMRAFRTVPMYRVFAEAIRDVCPGAWVINYTNPMAACVRTLYEVFPGIRAFGCCHEVFGTQHLLSFVLKDATGLWPAHRDDIEVNVLGVNHFTWIDRASYKGIDLMPLYDAFAKAHAETGYERTELGYDPTGYFSSSERVKIDLYLRYGAIAAAGDRHLAEFCPSPWYLRDPSVVAAWKFALTPVSWRVRKEAELRDRQRRWFERQEAVPLAASGEEGVRQLKALCGLGPLTTNVNLPNRGQVEGLPLGAVVETNCRMARDSARPVAAGRLPVAVEPLVSRHAAQQEGIVRAALTGDRGLAFAVFLNDPQLAGLGLADARALFDRMAAATAPYLPF
jgi:alpha-galactosidase